MMRLVRPRARSFGTLFSSAASSWSCEYIYRHADVLIADVLIADVLIADLLIADVLIADILIADVLIADVLIADVLIADVLIADVLTEYKCKLHHIIDHLV